MALKYLFKVNPLVAKAAGVTAFDRYTWPDGTFLLWEPDIQRIDRNRFYRDLENMVADYGMVRLTDPQAREEQLNPSIRLPQARLPEYRWTQPGGEDDGDGDTDGSDGSDGNGNVENENGNVDSLNGNVDSLNANVGSPEELAEELAEDFADADMEGPDV